jgi:thiosulfate/3-mercaptopyruvate sulfurtransferase
VPNIPPLVTVDDLAGHPDAVLADVRWYLDGRSGRDAYESGHLPGAVFVDLERDLTRHDLAATEGRHPLPSPEAFAAAMSALGIGDDSVVIAYDDTGGMTASRLVVMLRMIGHDAALLDGGLAAWRGELMTGPGATPEALPFTPCEWPRHRLADADETAQAAADKDALVIDARPGPRFTGEVTQIDPRPGHIPGARSAPWSEAIDPTTAKFRPKAALREHYDALGASERGDVIAYCGSGVSACVNVVAMEHAGLPVPRLYPGSWSGWSSDPERAAELGPGR